jgi:uncharacterized membrane protein YgcG
MFLCGHVSSQSNCFTPGVGTALTFYKGAMTTSARTSPITQLTCNGGNGCKYSNEVNTVQCTCTGLDGYGSAQWKCESSLPSYLELGNELVSCEGCTSSTDPMKLTGSCGLYYGLTYDGSNTKTNDDHTNDDNGITEAGFATFLIVVGVICGIIIVIACIVQACQMCANNYNSYETLPLHHDSFPSVDRYTTSSATPVVVTATNIQPVASAPPPPQTKSYPRSGGTTGGNTYISYQNPQPVARQSNTDNFTTGLLMGELAGGGRRGNHIAEDVLLMNMATGGGNSNFTTGLLMGEALSGNNHSNRSHHQSAPSHHGGGHHGGGGGGHHGGGGGGHHGGGHHVSTGFGGSLTR